MKIQPVILAAGKGKRIVAEAMEAGLGELPKVLYPIHGRPLIDYVLDVVAEATEQAPAGVEVLRPMLVVSYLQEKVREHVGERATYVEQLPAPLGTGHAVLVTEAASQGVDAILALNGDMPAWHAATLTNLMSEFVAQKPTLALATVDFTDPTYTADFFVYGRVKRDAQGNLIKIVEQKDATDEERAITECNPSLYLFDREWVYPALASITNHNSQGEFYLTDLMEIALRDGKKVVTLPCHDWREALGVNTFDQLKLCEELLT